MLIFFFDIKIVLPEERVPEGTTVDQQQVYNLQRRDEKKETRVIGKLIHSVSVYSVVSVLGWETGWSYRTSSFSVDLVTCDVFLFPEVKSALKGKHFALLEEVKQNMTELLIQITEDELWQGIEQSKIRMKQCAEVEGEFTEEVRN